MNEIEMKGEGSWKNGRNLRNEGSERNVGKAGNKWNENEEIE